VVQELPQDPAAREQREDQRDEPGHDREGDRAFERADVRTSCVEHALEPEKGTAVDEGNIVRLGAHTIDTSGSIWSDGRAAHIYPTTTARRPTRRMPRAHRAR